MNSSPLTTQVRQLCADGYRLYDTAEFRLALRAFYQAWLIIPKPQTEHVEAGWVLTAIGDAYFRLRQFAQGYESLQSALCCPKADEPPFIHLRLGQCLWELSREAEARKFLYHAYKAAGDQIFDNEDARYLRAIRDLTGQL